LRLAAMQDFAKPIEARLPLCARLRAIEVEFDEVRFGEVRFVARVPVRCCRAPLALRFADR